MPQNSVPKEGHRHGNFINLQTLVYPPSKISSSADVYRLLLREPRRRKELLSLIRLKEFDVLFDRVWIHNPALSSPILLDTNVDDSRLAYTLLTLLLREQGLNVPIPRYSNGQKPKPAPSFW
jgi:hypothetical protein